MAPKTTKPWGNIKGHMGKYQGGQGVKGSRGKLGQETLLQLLREEWLMKGEQG